MIKVFIDGSSGTTGLKIKERLKARADIELLEVPYELRHEIPVRKKTAEEADCVFLCLPDDAAKELAGVIDAFLRSLPEKECDIFVARYYFTYPTGEIAAKFGMSENHVRAVISRTRKKLAGRLGKEALDI